MPTTEDQIQKQIIHIKRLLTLGEVNLAIQQSEVLLRGIKMSEEGVNGEFYTKVGCLNPTSNSVSEVAIVVTDFKFFKDITPLPCTKK